MIKYKFRLTIGANFGSSFQRDTAIESLTNIVKAWAEFYRFSHKNNDICVSGSSPIKIKKRLQIKQKEIEK